MLATGRICKELLDLAPGVPIIRMEDGQRMREGAFPNGLPQKAALLVASTAFLSEIAGFLTHQLNLGLGFVLLLWFTFLCVSTGISRVRGKFFWLGLATMTITFVSIRAEVSLRPLLISVYLLGLTRVVGREGSMRRQLESLAVGAFSFGLFLIVERNSPLVWSLVQSLSLRFSSVVGRIGSQELLMGSSFSGIRVLFLLTAVTVPLSLAVKRNRAVVLCAVIVLFLVAGGVAIGLSHPVARAVQGITEVSALGVRAYDRVLLSVPFLTLLFGLVPLWAITREVRFREKDLPPSRTQLSFLVALLLLFASILSLTFMFPARQPGSARIAFYSQGYFNWMRPAPGEYGSRSAGMFGNLPVFAEALGFKTTIIDSISESTLQGSDVLFMANIDHELPAHSYGAIRAFVERGGSLLLLGDHTFCKEEKKNWLNAVLAPFGIRFNFDSADYLIGGWLHSYLFPPSPLTADLDDEQNEVGVVVGASLNISYPAVPIVVGKYGFSDEGDVEGGDAGYIGDLSYAPGEKLGDLVLAAAQNYGRGKVMVFGDTSGFVNPLMVDTYVFVGRVFDWLAGDERVPAHAPRLLISLVLLACFVLAISRSGLPSGRLLLLPAVAIVAVLLGQASASRMSDRPLRGRYVLVDDSHHGRFPLEFWKTEGLMGLHLNLMRTGCLSFNVHEFQQSLLVGSDLFVIVSPSRPYSDREVRVLDRYVRDGGTVFLCTGYEEKGASRQILRNFGFDVENIPLGGFFTEVPGSGVSVYFREAWPIHYSGEGYEVLAGYSEYPAAVVKEHGKGRIVVFGDSGFFRNINLETEDDPFILNIQFLNWLLDELEIAPGNM